MARHKPKPVSQIPVTAVIESLNHEGRGVAHVDGKVVFVDGALPGESVRFVYSKRHKRHDDAKVLEVISASPERVEPRCAHFGICGGCALQHLDPAAQLDAKQQVLLDSLRHIGRVEPGIVLAPLTGPQWGYRRKARLGVKYVPKKGRLMIGFRDESWESILRTKEFGKQLMGAGLDSVGFAIPTPYPGSEWYYTYRSRILDQYGGDLDAFMRDMGDATNITAVISENFNAVELLGLRELMLRRDRRKLQEYEQSWRAARGEPKLPKFQSAGWKLRLVELKSGQRDELYADPLKSSA